MSSEVTAGSAEGRRQWRSAEPEPGERSEAASVARSAREDDGAAITPSSGMETDRAAVPLRG